MLNCELIDVNNNGKVQPWREKRLLSEELSSIYYRLYLKYGKGDYLYKSERLSYCATVLEFNILSDKRLKLKMGNFCKIRLCPMCIWRRSLKIFSSVKKITDKIKDDYDFYFLTLTIKNVSGKDLPSAIDDLINGFKNLVRNSYFKNCMVGYMRTIEVTLNHNKLSKYYGTYHPHIHCICAMRRGFIPETKENIAYMWKKAVKINYYPQVDLRECKRVGQDLGYLLAEISKYCVKDKDIIINNAMQLDNIKILDYALKGRRLAILGGIMKETGSLLHIDDDSLEDDLIIDSGAEENIENVVTFVWSKGLLGYYSMTD